MVREETRKGVDVVEAEDGGHEAVGRGAEEGVQGMGSERSVVAGGSGDKEMREREEGAQDMGDEGGRMREVL